MMLPFFCFGPPWGWHPPAQVNRQHHHLWAKYEFRGGTMARVFTYKSINFFCFCLGSWPINMYTCGTYHILAACFSPKCAAVARDCSGNTGFEAATGSQGCSRSVWGADGCASGQDTPAQGFTPPPTPLPPYWWASCLFLPSSCEEKIEHHAATRWLKQQWPSSSPAQKKRCLCSLL